MAHINVDLYLGKLISYSVKDGREWVTRTGFVHGGYLDGGYPYFIVTDPETGQVGAVEITRATVVQDE